MIPLQKRSTAARRRGSSEHGLPPQLDRQQVDAGVEPDDELAALPLDRFGDPIRERRDRGRLVVRSHAHAAKATPFVAAQDRVALERDDPQLRRRPAHEGRQQEQLVCGDRLEVGGERGDRPR